MRGPYFDQDAGEGGGGAGGAGALADTAGAAPDAGTETTTETATETDNGQAAARETMAAAVREFAKGQGKDAETGQDGPAPSETPTTPTTPTTTTTTPTTTPAGKTPAPTTPTTDNGPVLKVPGEAPADRETVLADRLKEMLGQASQPAEQPGASPPAPAPVQPQAQPASATQAQPAAQASGVKVPFSDQDLSEFREMDPGMERIARAVNDTLAPLLQKLPQVDALLKAMPDIEAVVQYTGQMDRQRRLRIGHEITGVHGELAAGGFEDVYGPSLEKANDRQKDNWETLKSLAGQFMEREMDQGRYVTRGEALKVAHRILNADRIETTATTKARQDLESAVVKRHAQTDVVPGAGTGAPSRAGSPRERIAASIRQAKADGVL
jgi:hypothetical protein